MSSTPPARQVVMFGGNPVFHKGVNVSLGDMTVVNGEPTTSCVEALPANTGPKSTAAPKPASSGPVFYGGVNASAGDMTILSDQTATYFGGINVAGRHIHGAGTSTTRHFGTVNGPVVTGNIVRSFQQPAQVNSFSSTTSIGICNGNIYAGPVDDSVLQAALDASMKSDKGNPPPPPYSTH